MTKYKNISTQPTNTSVIKWIKENLNLPKKTGILVQTENGIIKRLEIDKKLSVTDKEKITAEFSELNNKEVN